MASSKWDDLRGRLTGLLQNAEEEESGRLAESAPSLLERASRATGFRRESSSREIVINNTCPNLTFKQRLYGFIICFSVGIVVSISSMFSFSFAQLLAGQPAPFAIRYTLGNVISLVSTGFIVGPARQLRQMTAPTRWISATIYLGAIAATLVSALVLHQPWLVLACIGVQGLSMIWYMLSYIPFARRAVSGCLKSAILG
mmetsp:Transcript_30598/g.67034  ORF Transcript_30598/g.67034 Transcript_30598/m.67034 type:complete len:200 (+) Transcript_30598:215-814(+)|eukprot:1733901-Pleurochrysis_carterae.AAC.7